MPPLGTAVGRPTRVGLVKFFGSAVSNAAGFTLGVAAGPAVRPFAQSLVNEAWSLHAVVPPDVGTLAEGVAQGQVDEGAARDWARQRGFGGDQFSALVSIANVGPGMAQAFNLWRRKQTDEAGFRRALKRLGLEPEWVDALWNVRESILDPAELARAIHRGLVPDPGLLEGELPSREGNVPAYPVYPIDALAEAQGSGIDHDRLGVMVGLQGNPMGAHEAAQAQFRHILTPDDYLRAVAEGNTRNEWAEAIREQSRQIPTARDFLENALRGYRSLGAAIEGAALHGMTPEHATMIYQNQGRPMIPRQITQALAWGAKFHPEPGEITDPYEASTVEGNVKPAYYELYKSLRYALPSAFFFVRLQQQGKLTVEEAKVWYRRLGWPPELVDQVSEGFSEASAAVADPHIAKAQTHLWNRTHASYIAAEITDAAVHARLGEIGIPADAQGTILELWRSERALIREQLTPTQIRKAVAGAIKNRETGAPWTRQDAVTALLARGYSDADAQTFLDEG